MNGPYVDDYFLVFVTGNEAPWQEASCYAEGKDKFLSDLGSKLNFKFDTKLYASTDFASRIIWPLTLSGASLFNFVDEKPSGVIARLRSLVGLKVKYSHLTDDVNKYLSEGCKP